MIPIKNGRVSQVYGKPGKYKKGYHTGIDLVAGINDKYIYNVAPGIVLLARETPGKGYDPDGWGNYVIVRQDNGHDVIYAHLARTCTLEGERLSPGDAVGIQGSTGNSTGAHLHFEVRKGDWKNCNDIDPTEYLGIENKKGLLKNKEVPMEKISIIKEGEKYEGYLIDGVAYGPVRALFQSQGQDVLWYSSDKRATITPGPLERLREIKRLIEGVK